MLPLWSSGLGIRGMALAGNYAYVAWPTGPGIRQKSSRPLSFTATAHKARTTVRRYAIRIGPGIGQLAPAEGRPEGGPSGPSDPATYGRHARRE